MHLRVKQQNSTALRMAHVLEAHPKVSRRKMTDFGGLVTFEID
ncbi:BnaAnng20570D [Brassica napus]|uniref:BnaAnng20570D protein n=1 Tax=Brassica napus TaxID=3708 RepID=A0A078JIC4_BRANA|nr:BnaAnng20570D [Brassica napus]